MLASTSAGVGRQKGRLRAAGHEVVSPARLGSARGVTAPGGAARYEKVRWEGRAGTDRLTPWARLAFLISLVEDLSSSLPGGEVVSPAESVLSQAKSHEGAAWKEQEVSCLRERICDGADDRI
jgi:hypothetical protein